MRLHSPAFEKALHAAGRTELRKSPEKWRVYRRTYWSHLPTWVPTALWWAAAVLQLHFIFIKPLLMDSPSVPAPVSWEGRLLIDLILTWGLLIGWKFWVSLQRGLLGPVQRLPLSQRHLFGKYVLDFGMQMVLLAVLLGFLGGLVSVYYQGRFLWWPGLVFGSLHVINIFALAMAWAAWVAGRPARAARFSDQTQGLVLCGILFGSLLLTMFLPKLMDERQLVRLVEPIYAMLPGGWVGEPFCSSLSAPLRLTWTLLPTILLGLLVPVWQRRLRARFISFTPDQQFVLRADEAPDIWTRGQAEEDLLRRLRAPADWWQSGWVERLVWRVLSAKERELAEVLFPGAPGWSSSHRRFTFWIMLLLASGWLVQPMKHWVAVSLYLLTALGLWVFGIFSVTRGGPGMLGELPFQLPPTARQYARVWMRIAWIRSLCALPVFLLVGFFWKWSRPTQFVDPVWLAILGWLTTGPVLAPLKPLFRIVQTFHATRRWQAIWCQLGFPVVVLPIYLPLFVATMVADRLGFWPVIQSVALTGIGLHGFLVFVNWAVQKQWLDFSASGATTTANGFPLKEPARQRNMAMAQRPGDFP